MPPDHIASFLLILSIMWCILGWFVVFSTVLLGCLDEAKMKAILMKTSQIPVLLTRSANFSPLRGAMAFHMISKKQIYVVVGLFRYRAWITIIVHVFTYLRPNIRKIFVAARSIWSISLLDTKEWIYLHKIKYLLNTLVYISIASTNIISSLCRSITQIGSTSIYWLRVSTNPFRRVHTKTNPFRTCTCSIFFSS